MKLFYGGTSPYARKVRIVATELGLIDKIELVATSVTPGKPNADYGRDINPLRKIPALTLDDGSTIVNSFLISEYLDELAGNRLMPATGAKRRQIWNEHVIAQGMLEAMLLGRYERMLRPEPLRWQAWFDDQWDRAWQGMRYFEERSDIGDRALDLAQIALACALGYADFRYADYPWRENYPKLAAFNEKMLQRQSIKETVPTTT